MLDIKEDLLLIAEIDNDTKQRSETRFIAQNEFGDFEFLVSIVISYEIIYAINLVSEHLR